MRTTTGQLANILEYAHEGSVLYLVALDLRDARKDAIAAAQEVARLQDRDATLCADVIKLAAERDAALALINNIQSTHAKAELAWRAQANSARTLIDSLQAERNNARDDCNAAMYKLNNAQAERDELCAELGSFVALRENNATLADALKAQIKRCETLTNDRALAQQEIAKQEQTIGRLLAQRDEAHRLAERATALAESENREKFSALCAALAFRQQRDEARETAIAAEQLCFHFQQERDELALECDDQALRMASAAVCLLEGSPAVVVPFAGEVVCDFTADDETCACGQTNSDAPCDATCAAIAAKQAPDYKCGDPACCDAGSVAYAAKHAADGPADDNKPKHFDAGKIRFDIVPPEGETAIADAFTYGAQKYGDHNWEKSPGLLALQYHGSMRRHLTKWRAGEDIDPESGRSHLGHVGANCMMLIATLARFPQSDNRKAQ